MVDFLRIIKNLKSIGYDCPFETPESKEVDHDKNNMSITLTLTLDGSNVTKDAKYCFKTIMTTNITLTRIILFPLNRKLLTNKEIVMQYNLPDNLESINGYDPQHKLEFSGLNTLDFRHGKLKEYYIFQDYKSLIVHTIVTQLINL
ncbi:hypothetical protein U3516DRAFT_751270 [Neocallimastix sp. 'constans']